MLVLKCCIKKKSPSVETERLLTLACHMKKSLKAVSDRQA